MIANKRKKNSRQRGSWTHGWGSKKKHRGAGNRGGCGRAGSGKRGDAKKPSYWKNKLNYGKHGFISKSRSPKINAVNLGYLENNLSSLEKKGIAEKKGEAYAINLKKLGFNKLLSAGKITKQYEITADYASAKAVEKVKALKGKVDLLNPSGSETANQKADETADITTAADSED